MKNAEWILGTDNCFHKAPDLFVESARNSQLLGEDTVYTKLKANDTFLRDIGVNFEPTFEQVINQLIKYRDKYVFTKTNQVKKMATIYQFIDEKLSAMKESGTYDNKRFSTINSFVQNKLLYLPRGDNNWWNPQMVYLRDYSDRFGTLRGYIENHGNQIYNVNLASLFKTIGIKESPLVTDCIDMLDDLKSSENIDLYKSVAPKIYQYINEIIDDIDLGSVDRPVFLSTKNTFPTLSNLYYIDDPDLYNNFKNIIELLWLPYSWNNLQRMLTVGGFQPISEYIHIKKRLGKLSEVDGENTEKIKNILLYALQYLKNKKIT